MSKPFYADWTEKQVLALVLQGIKRGKIKDQTILHNDPKATEGDSAALSTIIQHHIKL